MEDVKNTSANSEENQNEEVEIVQQEAELPITEDEQVTPENLSVTEEVDEQVVVPTEDNNASDEVIIEEVAAESEAPAFEEQVASNDDNLIESPEVAEAVVIESPSAAIEATIENPEAETVVQAEIAETAAEPEAETVAEVEDEDEDEDHHDENNYNDVVLDGATKHELLDWLKKISKEDNIRKIDHLFKDLGTHFETLFEEEKKTALAEFLATEGNEESDFDFKGHDIDREFHAIYENVRHKRAQFYQQVEKQKEENLARKTEVLDLIREAVDGEDQTSFNKIKKLQDEWKSVGPVSGAQNRTLWASYHALMDRFYDQRSIYFELKELDRKKNLQAKLDICARAEALLAEKNLKTAVTQLNELHEEFKHVGPVPREDQEALWQRFKITSDHIYNQRKELTEQQKEEHKKNLELKMAIAERATQFSSFESDRIKDWNHKTKELLALQQEWEAVGMVPREKARDMNKSFWGSFKTFFNNKGKFFKTLDAQREENLSKKKVLIEQAKAAKESTDWEKTTQLLKDLQNAWREIGPVPEKYRKSSYEDFKTHCDQFFEKRRGQNAEQNKEYTDNLNKKTAILNQLEELANANELDLEKAFELADSFSQIGLVPRNAIGKVLDRYDKLAKKIASNKSLSEDDSSDLKMHFEISKIRNSPHGNQKIFRRENTLKRKITGLENDINSWKNNLDFFAASKNADVLKKEFTAKIDAAESELVNLKQELRLLHD